MNLENVIDAVCAQQAALLQFKLIICVEQVSITCSENIHSLLIIVT